MVQGAVNPGLVEKSAADDITMGMLESGFPYAKTYIDSVDAWTTNEVDVYTVSSLAFLTGYLSLYNREVTSSPVVGLPGDDPPALYFHDGNLYCNSCSGPVQVNLYNVNGQLIYRNQKTYPVKGRPLIDVRKFLKSNAIILYKTVDESGRVGSGKIPVH